MGSFVAVRHRIRSELSAGLVRHADVFRISLADLIGRIFVGRLFRSAELVAPRSLSVASHHLHALGDVVQFDFMPPSWQLPYATMGQQDSFEGLDVEGRIAFTLTRSTGTFRRHTLAFCLCSVERRVTIVRLGDEFREDPDGKVALIPVYCSPDNPSQKGFLAMKDRIPSWYDPAIGRSRENQTFFADGRQLGLYFKTSEWPAKAEPAHTLVGETIDLFVQAALAEPPWPIGTAQR